MDGANNSTVVLVIKLPCHERRIGVIVSIYSTVRSLNFCRVGFEPPKEDAKALGPLTARNYTYIYPLSGLSLTVSVNGHCVGAPPYISSLP